MIHLSPSILQSGATHTITLHPQTGFRFEAESYRVRLMPIGGTPGQGYWRDDESMIGTPTDGFMQIAAEFPVEGEYILMLHTADGELLAEKHLYALEPDLYVRRAWKGDTHMHTHYSDGKESPAHVAAACRQIGLDFIAITDHRKYAPSIEAIASFEGFHTGLNIFPGEEVHPPDNRVHIVHFGGKFSINDLFPQDRYRQEVAALIHKLDFLPPGIDRYPFASCLWCFDQIREAGGLGIFCHPYWVYRQRYDVPAALTDLLFKHRPFDAYELIGGYHWHEAEANNLQVARYFEECRRGGALPIVGASDSHGVETGQLFGWYYTVVFSPTPALADLMAAIKVCNSVAVEALPGQPPHVYGPLRLVRYTHFLLREIFPQHDAACAEEGQRMLAHAAAITPS